MISAYPVNKKADKVLAAFSDDFYHDDIHALEIEDDANAIAISPGVTNISGGQNKHGFPASAVSVVEDNITHMSVNLDKNAAWFLKGVGGPMTRKGALKPEENV